MIGNEPTTLIELARGSPEIRYALEYGSYNKCPECGRNSSRNPNREVKGKLYVECYKCRHLWVNEKIRSISKPYVIYPDTIE